MLLYIVGIKILKYKEHYKIFGMIRYKQYNVDEGIQNRSC